jgi:hemoglobin
VHTDEDADMPGDARPATTSRSDISGRKDIAELLTDFYGRAFDDDLLRPVFVDIARMDLDAHLPVICDFWQTVLFHSGLYRRNALHPHLRLHAEARLEPAHFERWLNLWCATVDDRYAGPTAETAKLQAARIAHSMCRRITGRTSAMLDRAVGPRATPDGRRHASTDVAGLRQVRSAQPVREWTRRSSSARAMLGVRNMTAAQSRIDCHRRGWSVGT